MSPVALPRPLVRIALGAFIASVANLGVKLKPDIFFLLLLPPLLFLDGWRIPKEGLFRDKVTILELALGLVVFTVVGVGFLINWMIPEMPVAIAFALAAIVSPTDPDGALDRIVVEFDAAVIEEAGKGGPARERITNGLGEGAGGWNAAKLHLEPRLHHLDERPGAGVTHMPTCVCGAALDRSLDRIEFGDPPQGLGGDR